jgi:ATP-binding cassette subfamily B protein
MTRCISGLLVALFLRAPSVSRHYSQLRIANDIGGMQSVVTNTATSIAQNATTVAATVVALFLLDWKLATFSLIILPIFVRVARRIGDERRKISTKRQKLLSDLSVQIEESLSVSGILLGKTTGSAQALTDKFADRSHEVAGVELAAMMAGKWRMATIQISFAVMPALVYWFAGITIGQGSALTIGTLVAFTALQTQLFRPTMQLLNTGVEVQASLALFGRVFEYLDLPIDVAEPEHPVTLSRESVRGDVAFRGVDFTYAAATVPTLCNIDLDVPAGSTLALVGATGSGKTTLGYLVARLHDPTAGSVTIDGVDLRHMASENIADLVGVVSQETYLFHATIRENLRFAKPDATDDEIVAAARTAQIHDFIDGLDDGYDTTVGERGYERLGQSHRTRSADSARRFDARAYHHSDRASPVHRACSRRHCGTRSRHRARGRKPRGSARRRRYVRPIGPCRRRCRGQRCCMSRAVQ